MPDNPVINPRLITAKNTSWQGFDIRVDPSMEKDDYIMIASTHVHETTSKHAELDENFMDELIKLEKRLSSPHGACIPPEIKGSFISRDILDVARIYPPEFLREYCNKAWYLPALAPSPSPIVAHAMSPIYDEKIYHWGAVPKGEEKIENAWLIRHFLDKIMTFLDSYVNDELCDMLVFIKNKKFYTDKMVKAFDDIEYNTKHKGQVPSLTTLIKYIE